MVITIIRSRQTELPEYFDKNGKVIKKNISKKIKKNKKVKKHGRKPIKKKTRNVLRKAKK